MPLSITIPNVVYPTGTTTYGPANLVPGDYFLGVTLDRNVASGLNSKTSATTVTTVFEIMCDADPNLSPDVTPGQWYECGRTSFEGGIRINSETNQQLNIDNYETSLWQQDLPGRHVRLTLTVAGTSVRLSGSLSVT